MKKLLTNPKGFTLVELMVVVAIIGILSAIAVPNFKKYQAKSKQSEAKIQLAAVYSVEVSASGDYDTYATCINSLGYEQTPKGYYVVGFAADVNGATYGNAQVRLRGGVCVAANNGLAPATHLKNVEAATVPGLASITGTSQTSSILFTAGARGQIGAAALTMDNWTIDQTKALVNNASGI